MTQSPPPVPPSAPVDYGYSSPQRRGNAAAIVSLILGILGCVPLVTGVLAILFGVVGVRKTRDPAVGGKGLAIAGIVLGVVSVVLWAVFGGIMLAGYVASKPARLVARQFIADVQAGNTQGALNESAGLSAAQIQADTQRMANWGAVRDTTFSSYNVVVVNGATTVHLVGTATFATGTKAYLVDLTKQGGVYKVTSYSVP